MTVQHLAAYQPIVGCQIEIASFIEDLRRQTRPPTQDSATADLATQHEHHIGVTVIGSAIAVLARGATKLRHRDYDGIFQPIAEIAIKSTQAFAKLPQAIGQLTGSAPFIDVCIPTL